MEAPPRAVVGLVPMRHNAGMIGRVLLAISAVILFITGAAALFASEELAGRFDATGSRGLPLALQLLGGALLGFAVLNWTTRRTATRRGLARSASLGNLLLFASFAVTLGRAAATGVLPPSIMALCLAFWALAAAFAWLAFIENSAA